MIALSILHGGPGPSFFAPSIVDYLFGGISSVNPSDPDFPTIVGRQLNQLTVYFYIVLSVGKTP